MDEYMIASIYNLVTANPGAHEFNRTELTRVSTSFERSTILQLSRTPRKPILPCPAPHKDLATAAQ
ncbi:hypothetical protein BGZ65_000955, partial [Modicella reniformis]